MGQLIDGVWHDTWYDTKSTGGKFQRSVSAFRNWLTADGEAGPSGVGGFAAEKDRYHLYVSLACPVGAPHADSAQTERAGAVYLRFRGQPADAGKWLDL
jgi:Predicted glutathione S-transferase